MIGRAEFHREARRRSRAWPRQIRASKVFVCAAWIFGILSIASASATSNYSYKHNEYVVVQDGTAPNRRFSISAHGNGNDGYDNFHLYLMAEPGHKKIGVLEEVGPEILDTGADAYRAVWSADSRHVALFYRADRHVGEMAFYRIENSRAYPIKGPSLLGTAAGRDVQASKNVHTTAVSSSLVWLSPTRFTLAERYWFKSETRDLLRLLGRFGKDATTDEDKSAGQYFVQFAAEAECELIAGDKYRVVNLVPGQFDN